MKLWVRVPMFRWFWMEYDLPFLSLGYVILGLYRFLCRTGVWYRRHTAWYNEFSNPFVTHRADKALREWLLCLTTLIGLIWFIYLHDLKT